MGLGRQTRSSGGRSSGGSTRREARHRERHEAPAKVHHAMPTDTGHNRRTRRSHIQQDLAEAQEQLNNALSDASSMRQALKLARKEAAVAQAQLASVSAHNAALLSEAERLRQQVADTADLHQHAQCDQRGHMHPHLLPRTSEASDLDTNNALLSNQSGGSSPQSPTTEVATHAEVQLDGAAPPQSAGTSSGSSACAGCAALRARHSAQLEAAATTAQQQLLAMLDGQVRALLAGHQEQMAAVEGRAAELVRCNAQLVAQLQAAGHELGLLRLQAAVERTARLRALGCDVLQPSPTEAPTASALHAHSAADVAIERQGSLSRVSSLFHGGGLGSSALSPRPSAYDFNIGISGGGSEAGALEASAAAAAAAPWAEPSLIQLQGNGCVGHGGFSEVYALLPEHGPCHARTTSDGGAMPSSPTMAPAHHHAAKSQYVVKVSELLQLPSAGQALTAAAGVSAAAAAGGVRPNEAAAASAVCSRAVETAAKRRCARDAAHQMAAALADLVPAFLPAGAVPHLARPLHWYWRADTGFVDDDEVDEAQVEGEGAAGHPCSAGAAAATHIRTSDPMCASPFSAPVCAAPSPPTSVAGSRPPGFSTPDTTAPAGSTAAAQPHVRLYTVWPRYECDLEQYLASGSSSTDGPAVRHHLLGWREAAAIACSVAEAVAGLHALGAVHCDIRPPNVLLRVEHANSSHAAGRHTSATGAAPVSRVVGADLADCGLLTWLPPGAAAVPIVQPGSWLYRAPEACTWNLWGACSDVWQLGLLLSALLTRRPAPRAHQGSPLLAGPEVAADVAVCVPEGLNDRATYLRLSELVPPEEEGGEEAGAACEWQDMEESNGPPPAALQKGEDEDLLMEEGEEAESGSIGGAPRAQAHSGSTQRVPGAATTASTDARACVGDDARIRRVMVRLARACLQQEPSTRPSASEVASVLQWVLGC